MTANPESVRVDAERPESPSRAGGRAASAGRLGCCLLALVLAACASRGTAPASVPAREDLAAAGSVGAPTAAAAPPVATAAPSAGASAADVGVLRPATRARYRELRAGGGQVYQLDPLRSDIRIYAFRAGLAARLGHNHVIAVPHFSGLAWAPAKGLRGASADLGFRLSELQVDAPALRAETGGGFASPLDADAIRGTLEHLLGAQGFDAASHPWIEASATVETGELPLAIADFALSLHGETHHQRIPLRIQADDRHLEVSGTLAFRQGDYGIKPYAVMGGLLAVDDLVAVEFHLRGVPLNGAIP